MPKYYTITISNSAKKDIKEMKLYILKRFVYREYANNFSKKIKSILKTLNTFPDGHQPTSFIFQNYVIYLKPKDGFLIFYTVNDTNNTVTILRVLRDYMNWQKQIHN